jgi:glycosyltransferase involved in cell wall biosynthesis
VSPAGATPEVSVVIPTRDRWELLARSAGSALGQRDVSIEVIVVDDGSSTRAPDWLASSEDERLALCRGEVSGGVAHARNTGIAQARGDWIAFLDDDDVWAPGKLRAQLDTASAAPSDFVYSGAVIVDGRLDPLRLWPPPGPEELRQLIRERNAIPAGQSNVLAKTTLVRELGGFDEELSMIADWEMWIRLVAAGTGRVCPEVHVAWVIHDANMHLVDRGYGAEFDHLADRHLDGATRRRAEIFEAKWRAHGHRRAGDRVAASRAYLRAGVAHRSPSLVVRGVAVLAGESVMRIGQAEPELPAAGDVAWLDDYRST